MSRRKLEDEDGIDGPFERNTRAAEREDARARIDYIPATVVQYVDRVFAGDPHVAAHATDARLCADFCARGLAPAKARKIRAYVLQRFAERAHESEAV